MDSLNDLKRSFTKSASIEGFNNELNDLKGCVNEKSIDSRYSEILHFILEEAETARAGKGKRADPAWNSPRKALQLGRYRDDEGQSSRTLIRRNLKGKQLVKKAGEPSARDEKQIKYKGVKLVSEKQGNEKKAKAMEEETAGKRKKILEIYVKVEGEKKASNPVSKTQGKVKRRLEKAAGTMSNPVFQRKKANVQEDEPVKKKKVQLKEEEQSNPEPDVIEIDDDDDKGSPVPEQTPPPSQMKDKGKGFAIEQPIFASPFVPSRGRQERLLTEGFETLVFRDEVLTVQGQPFDLDEYSRLQEAVIAGSFLDRHDDLKRLLLSQYKREKRLAILRGFFFWLQNVGRKGAFKPWNDCACLGVDPPHLG